LSGCITKLCQVLQTFTWPETTSETHCTISLGDALTAQALVDMIAHHASHLASTQSLHARAEDVATWSDTPRGSPLHSAPQNNAHIVTMPSMYMHLIESTGPENGVLETASHIDHARSYANVVRSDDVNARTAQYTGVDRTSPAPSLSSASRLTREHT